MFYFDAEQVEFLDTIGCPCEEDVEYGWDIVERPSSDREGSGAASLHEIGD